MALDGFGQIILQLQGELIVHVDLNRREQKLADSEYGYPFHGCLTGEGVAGALERQGQRVREVRLGGHTLQIHSQMHDRLGNLRAARH